MKTKRYIDNYKKTWSRLVSEGVSDTQANRVMLSNRLWEKFEKMSMVDLYDDVFNAVSGGASLQEVKNELTGVPAPAIEDAYDKATKELGQYEFNGNKQETSPAADDTPKEGSHVNSQNDLTDALAARIIEQLALVQSASAEELAQNLSEHSSTVRTIAKDLYDRGIVVQAGPGRAAISSQFKQLLSELVSEDGLSLSKAAFVVKEATDSDTEDVETVDSVEDSVPFSSTNTEPDPGADGETAPAVDLIVPDDGQEEDAVGDSVADLPDASVDAEPDPGAEGVTAPAVDDVDSVNESVPFGSAEDGEPEHDKVSSLARIIRRRNRK